MAEEPDRPATPSPAPSTCPQCGAPLPPPSADGWATCAYCGVRTELSQGVPLLPAFSSAADSVPTIDPIIDTAEDNTPEGSPFTLGRLVFVVVVVVILLVLFAVSQAASNSSVSQGSPVASCSVAISPSATSGPAPFTASFTAVVTTPSGDSVGEPMWQFGPFPSGLDLNYTYGTTVTHTWDTNGTYGVHVSVPDSSLQGCSAGININVT